VFADASIAEDAHVDWTVVDSNCVIGPAARVGDPDAEGTTDPAQVTLIGKDSRVGSGVRIEGGARLEPGTTA
jgi:glucose-1-phosphate adenylyltransferase